MDIPNLQNVHCKEGHNNLTGLNVIQLLGSLPMPLSLSSKPASLTTRATMLGTVYVAMYVAGFLFFSSLVIFV